MTFAFVGGSYQNAILRADAQSAINLYPETDRSGAGKTKAQLVGTPGLQVFATLPAAPVRGIWIGEQRMFAVGGANLYEVHQDASITLRGNVGDDSIHSPVQIFPNGNQLGVVSAGYFWCDSGGGPVRIGSPAHTGTAQLGIFGAGPMSLVYWKSGDTFDATMIGQSFTLGGSVVGNVTNVPNPHLLQLDTPSSYIATAAYSTPSTLIPASSGTYQDGYAIVCPPYSSQFNISKLYDFSQWDPLDFAVKEGYPDHISAVISDHVNLYLLGTQTTEIWRNTGNPDFPFERIPGEVLQIGLVAPNSPDRIAGGIAFLGTDSRGGPVAFLLVGYQWRQFSTPPLETIWAKYASVTDAVAYTYVDGGHSFWVLSFPTANATWVWDATEDQWHQRAYNGTANRIRGYLHGYVWGAHYTGDFQNGTIYKMARDIYTDAGTAITRQRTAAHLAQEARQLFYSDFTLDVQPGEIDHPVFTLSWSRDGGNTYLASRDVVGGPVGEYRTRFKWRRLGAAGRGRVRTFRVTSMAPMMHCWIDGYYEATKGTD